MRRLYYSDDDFGQMFRDSLGDYREVPPRGNWKKINARLDKRVIRRYTGWIGVAATALALVILGVSINISTRNARLHNEALKQQLVKQNFGTNNKAVQPNRVQPPSTKPIQPVLTNANVNAGARVANDLATNDPLAEATQRTQESYQKVEQALTVVQNALSRTHENVLPITPLEVNAVETFGLYDLILAQVEEEQFVVSNLKPLDESCYNFYVGIALQPQHNMFYSESAIHDRRMTYGFSPGYALGVTAGYNVFSKLAVETGGMWSVENQNYEFAKTQSKSPALSNAANAHANETKVGLTYVRVPLTVKYKMRWTGDETACNNSINVLGGVQYGRFFGGTSEAQKKYELTDEDIKKNDLQVMLGAERSQPVTKNLTLNYGLRFGYGVTPMASGQSQRINTIYKPHNMLAAVNVSLNLHK